MFKEIGTLSELSARPTGPVITETVTRKRIVLGVYGNVEVGTVGLEAGYFGIYINADMNRAYLIAARDVFNQLIDALEE